MIDLRFNHVSKLYRIRQERGPSENLLTRALGMLRRRSDGFWALKDISFEVRRGESLGVIGPNGAGKSTVLKLLSKITAPTAGEIMIRGKLSALIEVGSGFHPELTGRENVYLSGSILGMRQRSITRQFDSIVDFAEVRQFIDTPVKRYSSGMYVRLGFSIAAHLHPDILLLDEVLAVGDAAFQAKCFRRIRELRENGTTILFISHDLNAVEALCDRALLLTQGKISAEGRPSDVILSYEKATERAMTDGGEVLSAGAGRGPVSITGLTFLDHKGLSTRCALTGKPLITRVEFMANAPVESVVFEVFFYSGNGKLFCHYSTALGGQPLDICKGAGVVEFCCTELGLSSGFYYADVVVKHNDSDEEMDWRYRSAVLQVDSAKRVLGNFYAPHNWRVLQNAESITSASRSAKQVASSQEPCEPLRPGA